MAVRAAFEQAALDERTALIAYLMAGYPDEPTSVAAAQAAVEAGADLLEIGVPFSDPVADGPVIADAGRRALATGGGLDGALRCVAALRARGVAVPILAMSYLNPLVARDARAGVAELAAADADGVIVPDLPAGEDPVFERAAIDAGLAACFLVAPNTDTQRVERAIASSSGFVYVVPLFGVTGARERLAGTALPLLERVRRQAAGRAPIAAGFGISRPEHVTALADGADGVVVGSALVAALDGQGAGGPERVAALVGSLATAARRPSRQARRSSWLDIGH